MSPFIIYALPRSRTKWLSHFLTYRDWLCGHEEAIFMRSLRDVERLFEQDCFGTVETAAAQGWRIINALIPSVRQVVIRRPVSEVVHSMMEIDLNGVASYDRERLTKGMEYGDRMLAQVSAQPGVRSYDFADLEREEVCRDIFEFCLPYRFDRNWYLACKEKNIQVDVVSYIKYYWEHFDEIKAFKSECWSELRKLAKAGTLRRAA